MITILPILLTLCGGQVVTQIRNATTGDIRNQISVIGAILAIAHFAFGIYSDIETEKAANNDPDTFREPNNIMRAIVTLGRITSLSQQPLLAVLTYCQSKNFRALLISVDELDEYLTEEGVKVQVIVRKLRLWDRLTAGVLFVVTILNTLIILYLFTAYYEIEATVHDMYISLLPITNFLLTVLVSCLYLYGVEIRMKSYASVLRDLFVRCQQHQNQPVCWKDLARKYVI